MKKKIENIYLMLFGLFSFVVITYGSYTDYISFQGELSSSNILSLVITYTAGIMGVICVVLVAKENIWNYLFGIISVSLWLVYVILWSPLIWDALINITYLVLNFYGLYYWLNPKKEQKSSESSIAVTRYLTNKEKVVYTVIAVISIVVLTIIGKKIGRYDNSTQALTDASSTVFAIFGQWFMSLKLLENWYMWIIVNIISIPLYISIGSYTLAMVWAAYLINAIYGYIMWKYNMKNVVRQ
ncbi:MAG: nicotinamide riboside transporter PnuC [Brevinemataceae bacterium]